VLWLVVAAAHGGGGERCVRAQGSERQLGLMIEELMDPLTHMVESVVAQHDGQEVVDTANYLMDGFAKLRTRQEPRLHAELVRAIQTIPSDTMTRVVRAMVPPHRPPAHRWKPQPLARRWASVRRQ
jgi:hypothetical protein